MQSTSPENPAQQISEREVLAQLERILSSSFFCNAPSLQQFLQYVVRKRLRSEQDEIKEYSVGREVFGRDASYDPASDSIVRVQANHLRKRLESYYQQSNDELVIEFPKGSYIPQFRRCVKSEPAIPAPRRRPVAPILALIGCFVLGLAVMAVIGVWRSEAPQNAPRSEAGTPATSPVFEPLWGDFLRSDTPVVLAYGIPVFYWAEGLQIRDVEVNKADPILRPDSRLGHLQRRLGVPFKLTEDYIESGDGVAAYLIGRFFHKAGRDVRLVRSRIVGWNELKSENVIFVACLRIQTLANELAHPVEFEYRSTEEIRKRWPTGCIVNLRPRVGEAREYPQQVMNGYGQDYALLSVWPGKRPGRNVMVMGGSHHWGTEGVADYLTNPDSLQELNQQLQKCAKRQGLKEHPQFFQILLRVEIKDQQPVRCSYVTHRDLEIPGNGSSG